MVGSLWAQVEWSNSTIRMASTPLHPPTGWLSTRHSSDFCSSALWGIRPLLASLPFLARLAQCCRRAYDDPALAKREH